MTKTFSTAFEDDWKGSQKYTTLIIDDKIFKRYNPNYVRWLLYKKGQEAHVPFERVSQIVNGLNNLWYDWKEDRFLDENGFNYLMEKFDAECSMHLDWGSYLER